MVIYIFADIFTVKFDFGKVYCLIVNFYLYYIIVRLNFRALDVCVFVIRLDLNCVYIFPPFEGKVNVTLMKYNFFYTFVSYN